MYAYFGDFSCPNSTKMAKITWPVSMATRFKSHKSDTGFWLFALKYMSCANFFKIGDYRFPPILVILRSLQRSHFKLYMWRHIDGHADWRRKFDLRSGSKRHRYFVGFFNEPVQAPSRATLFIRLFWETAQFSRLLRHTRDTEDTFSTWLPGHHGVKSNETKVKLDLYYVMTNLYIPNQYLKGQLRRVRKTEWTDIELTDGQT